MRGLVAALGAIGLAQALLACQPTHVFVTHQTVVGVDAAVDSQMTKGHLIIGYDRTFFAVVPKSVESKENGTAPGASPNNRDAMSVIACSNIKVDGIVLSQFTENMATGKAAKIYAENLHREGGNQLFRCLDKK
ncbi:MAG TPA: hypothetical protein VIF14_07940 [Alphaproteobacteria bacterium]|jgi:hypothetical protein